jgi:DNA modification methylase
MTVRIMLGDARQRLRELPDESVHCVVTSPPYFGLRDYGTASWEGGDPACDHGAARIARRNAGAQSGVAQEGSLRDKPITACKCGATRTDRQIGLEPTPAEFVAVMVEVFREVRRVLRPDGTLWLNVGDSYSSGGRTTQVAPTLRGNGKDEASGKQAYLNNFAVRPGNHAGFKPKDLLGIPWRVAFALQADGWYLRQDIIWSKPNPMPESVTDRCTKAHEYLFLLSKSARYHYDAEAIREGDDVYTRKAGGYNSHGEQMVGGKKPFQGKGGFADSDITTVGRNKRSVWEIATQPFSEAHFATFPPDLIEPCIKAGCPKDCCAKCGAPVVRVIEKTYEGSVSSSGNYAPAPNKGHLANLGERAANMTRDGFIPNRSPVVTDMGAQPTCTCDAGLVPGRVLDPFGGAGTTGLVADRLQRDAILIELNSDYAALAERRIRGDAPLFAAVAVARRRRACGGGCAAAGKFAVTELGGDGRGGEGAGGKLTL